MPHKPGSIQLPILGKLFICLLAIVYLATLIPLVNFLYPGLLNSDQTIVEHQVDTNAAVSLQHWTVTSMLDATEADVPTNVPLDLTQGASDQGITTAAKAVQQKGQAPRDGSVDYPLSTVGKVFFTSAAGQDMVCSGTAVVSSNRSVVDTAGHCLYWNRNWVKNLIFCPLYESGSTPYGCWAARQLEVPADWLDAQPNDLHHDLGMAIVSANSQGLLTDLVGGAGWAYNLPANQAFYAYGYPAAYPFDGQTRRSCDQGSSGKTWNHAGGTVISIPCNMTGGSSGGPWYIKSNNNWYVNGHNDFTSTIQPGHMFSPYYDATWYALYDKAQRA